MTVDEAVRFTRSFYPHWNAELLEQILDHFALPRRAKIRRLSNGQRAQVSLALAVAPDPELLILDDPTLGLDTVVRRDFLESLIQIIQRQGRTILISSHILGDVERVADRIGILIDGVLRVDCPTDHFKESVRKVVLEFSGEPPQFPKCDGLVSSWRVGNRLEVVLIGYDAQQQRLVESLSPESVEVLELNLEDAFIEYTRSSRRSLPLLSVENRHDERAYV
jgi:ABC-2 type transport system ATP-binding protein